MRSVLRDRDHVVLHRNRTSSKSNRGHGINDNSKIGSTGVDSDDRRRQRRDISVHFASTVLSSTFEAATAERTMSTSELVRLIDDQSYLPAAKRVYEFPKEASAWVCVPDLTNDGLQMARGSSAQGVGGSPGRVSSHPPVMMLPIHVACENLKNKHVEGETSDKRAHLEALVRVLVSVFPASCLQRNPTGQLPLHVALRNEASVETITTMLCAAPTSIMHVDTSAFPHLTPLQIINQLAMLLDEDCGTAPLLYQQQRHRLQVVHQMLSRGVDFWNLARQEAVLRSKHRKIPLEDSSISSLSVLAASFNDDASTLATAATHHYRHFHSPPLSHPQADEDKSPRSHYPLPPALFAGTQSHRTDFQKDHDPNGQDGGGGMGINEERKNCQSPDSPHPKSQALEHRVDELVERVVALESDKKSLQSEIALLHRELAKHDPASHAGRREGPNGSENHHDDPDLTWLLSVGVHPHKPQHPEQSRRRGAENTITGGSFILRRLQKEKEELESKIEALTKCNREYERIIRSNAGTTPSIPYPASTFAEAEAGSRPQTAGASEHTSQSPSASSVPMTAGLPEDFSPASVPAPQLGDNQEDSLDVDSVLLRAEQLAGHRLSQEMVEAWRGVMRSGSTDSVSELGSTSDGQNGISVFGEDDDGWTSHYSSSSSSATPGPRSVL